MVPAHAIRNALLDDPILDWLEVHGRSKGFEPDLIDDRTDLGAFLAMKGQVFETVVLDWLAAQVPCLAIQRPGPRAFQVADAAATFQALLAGAPAVMRGTLAGPVKGLPVHARPSLLLRSDVLLGLFPGTVTPEEAATPAPRLGLQSAHYVVVGVRYTTLELADPGGLRLVRGRVADAGETYLASRILGDLQGHRPSFGLLLGRQARTSVGSSRHLAAGRVAFTPELRDQVVEALAWLTLVRAQGASWSVEPAPTDTRLRPNMKNDRDAPWRVAKARIAAAQGELTRLWFVGPAARDRAVSQHVTRLGDPRLSAELLGVRGEPGRLLDGVLKVNTSDAGSPVAWTPSPAHPIPALEAGEVHCHLEATNDLDDDLRGFPACGGQPCVFLISAGWFEGTTWRTATFTSDSLSGAAEARMIDAWLAHLRGLQRGAALPRLITWSPAERTSLEDAWNAAVRRHPGRGWPALRWFDLYQRVVRPNAVIVRGALTFQLVEYVRALTTHGLVPPELIAQLGGPSGSGAVAAAFAAAREAELRGCLLGETALLQALAARSAAHCRALWCVLSLLRTLSRG